MTNKMRKVTLDEIMRAQCMVPKRMWGWFLLMTPSKMGHACGNAMSINILMRILPRALRAAGLIEHHDDPWLIKNFTPTY